MLVFEIVDVPQKELLTAGVTAVHGCKLDAYVVVFGKVESSELLGDFTGWNDAESPGFKSRDKLYEVFFTRWLTYVA